MAARGRRPRRPAAIRTRFAIAFSALVVLFGAGALALNYFLVAHVLPHRPPQNLRRIMEPAAPGGPPPSVARLRALIGPAFQQQQGLMLEHILIGSAIALLLLGIATLLLSRRIAERALAPLRTITETARRLSHENLGQRIALAGPDDELKELADTFDGMLARLEQAFQDQRQFVANASHELRTPLAVSRSLLEVAQADPEPSLQGWQATAGKLLEQSARMEHLISSLLLLARGAQGMTAAAPGDLEELVEEALGRLPPSGPRLRHRLRPAPVQGDPTLLSELCGNLLENAARYNRKGGFLSVATGTSSKTAWLRVSNSGPRVPPEEVSQLLLPFRRLAAQRTQSQEGVGLGLAICDAVAKAHLGSLTLRARPAGGLTVTVCLPRRL